MGDIHKLKNILSMENIEEKSSEHISEQIAVNGLSDNTSMSNDEALEEDERSQNIAKLLSHTQLQLLQDEDALGDKKKGFEKSACLNLDIDTVSETNVPDAASRSCFIKFRQLSDSVDSLE